MFGYIDFSHNVVNPFNETIRYSEENVPNVTVWYTLALGNITGLIVVE